MNGLESGFHQGIRSGRSTANATSKNAGMGDSGCGRLGSAGMAYYVGNCYIAATGIDPVAVLMEIRCLGDFAIFAQIGKGPEIQSL